jgi:hypothetical protein
MQRSSWSSRCSCNFYFIEEAPYQRHTCNWLHASVQSCHRAKDYHRPRTQCIYVIAERVFKTECCPAKAC